MAVRTIALDREAYDILKSLKDRGESFSDVVKRLCGGRRPLSDFAGLWTSLTREELKKIEEAMQRGRELDRERIAEILKR